MKQPTIKQLITIKFLKERRASLEFEEIIEEYRDWAEAISEAIPHSIYYEQPFFIHKYDLDSWDIYKVEGKKYFISSYINSYYGFLFEGTDNHYSFIGISINNQHEEYLLNMLEIELSSLFGEIF